MNTTTTDARPHRSRHPRLDQIAPAVLLAVAAFLAVQISLSAPDRRTVSFDNRTGAFVTVATTGRDRDGWLGLGTLDPKARTTFYEVIDQGEIWRFQLTVGPDRIGEIRRTSAQLRADHWTVTIPADSTETLPSDRIGPSG